MYLDLQTRLRNTFERFIRERFNVSAPIVIEQPRRPEFGEMALPFCFELAKALKRPPRQIGIHALRVGDTIGEHEVHFGSLGETLTLRHSAHTRDTFVTVALRAAAWLAGKSAGRYQMHDVL
jgi:hypothetical protein